MIALIRFGPLLLLALALGWQTVALHKARAHIAALHADAVQAELEATHAKEAREAEHRAQIETVALSYQEALQNAAIQHDRTVSDLRSGIVRLRSEFTCPAPADLPRTPAGAGVDHAGTDIRGSDALHLAVARSIELAAQCDAQLSAAQDIIRSDRQ